jgi:hypothetical protein
MDDIRKCVARLINNQPGAHQVMADFCEVGTPAVLSWAESKYFPRGETLVRVLVFVQAAGCKSSEWAGMSVNSRELAKLVAYNLVTLEGVRENVGYESMNGVLSTILRGNTPTKTRLYRIERLLGAYKPEIEAADGALRAKLADFQGDITPVDSPSMVEAAQPVPTVAVDMTPISVVEVQVVPADVSVLVRPTVLMMGALASLIDELDGDPEGAVMQTAVLLGVGPATIHKVADWFKRSENLL